MYYDNIFCKHDLYGALCKSSQIMSICIAEDSHIKLIKKKFVSQN